MVVPPRGPRVGQLRPETDARPKGIHGMPPCLVVIYAGTYPAGEFLTGEDKGGTFGKH